MKKDELKIGHVYETRWGTDKHVLMLYVKDAEIIFWIENPTHKGGLTPISNLVAVIEWTEVPLTNLTSAERQFLHDHGIHIYVVAPLNCTCESHFLFNNGCQCGYLKAQRQKVS